MVSGADALGKGHGRSSSLTCALVRECRRTDEKLIYICKLSYRAGPLVQGDWQAAIGHVCRSVKVGSCEMLLPYRLIS
jgi:hypothetical protein